MTKMFITLMILATACGYGAPSPTTCNLKWRIDHLNIPKYDRCMVNYRCHAFGECPRREKSNAGFWVGVAVGVAASRPQYDCYLVDGVNVCYRR